MGELIIICITTVIIAALICNTIEKIKNKDKYTVSAYREAFNKFMKEREEN